MYIYEGHMGHLYTSNEELDYEDLYCEQCGDHDWLIGQANTREEAWNLLKEDVDTFDEAKCQGCEHVNCEECENYLSSGGWDKDYVLKFIHANWEE